MKNLWIALAVYFFCVGCSKNNNSKNDTKETSIEASLVNQFNPLGVDSTQLIPGSYLFYLDEKIFVPILSEREKDQNQAIPEELIKIKKAAIIDYFKKNTKYIIEEDDVFVLSFSAIRINDISEDQAIQILNDVNIIGGQNDFTIQNIRPKMQAQGPMDQNIRPKMQEEWQYDTTKHTSTNVEFVNPNGLVGSNSTKIWIVDTGVDGNHQDLNVIGELSKSFVDNETDPLIDILGHGTHCAGIAAGKAHHESDSGLLGMNGVSPGAPIVSVKVINWNGEGRWTKVLEAMEYIISESNSGDIISLSIGDKLPGNSNPNKCEPMPDPNGNPQNKNYLLNQIEELAKEGVFVVMAAGNTGSSSEGFFPGCFDYPTHVFTVGSINTRYDFSNNSYVSTFSVFSSTGMPSIDFVAPGEMMFSTFPDNRYAVLSGTSMSTALMAGIIHAKGGMPIESGQVIGPPNNTSYPVAKVQ